MIKGWAFVLGVAGILAPAPAWADRDTARYTSITVFGDSLVDAGNLYIADGGTRPEPEKGYFEHRFSNGYDYPDLLSLQLFGVPTTPSLAGGSNYAFGGARVVDTGDGLPDLQAQLGMFEASGPGIDPNGLYIFNFGGNDVFAARGEFGANAIGTYTDTSTYLQAAADQYVAGVQDLINLGARNILMTDFPLFGEPLTVEANGYLATALANLTIPSDTSFFFYSLSDFNRRALLEPASLGLPQLQVATNCVDDGAQASGCAGYFSFDGVHATAVVQAAGAKELDSLFGLTAAQAVPEPVTWAMMCIGFGAIGATMRYRGRAMRVGYDFAGPQI
jgi:outer membrane lipase/esterase